MPKWMEKNEMAVNIFFIVCFSYNLVRTREKKYSKKKHNVYPLVEEQTERNDACKLEIINFNN